MTTSTFFVTYNSQDKIKNRDADPDPDAVVGSGSVVNQGLIRIPYKHPDSNSLSKQT